VRAFESGVLRGLFGTKMSIESAGGTCALRGRSWVVSCSTHCRKELHLGLDRKT
jgi:hypothetical protein